MSFLERTPYDSYRLGQKGDEMLTSEPILARKPANEEVAKVPKKKKGVEDPERQFKDGDLAALRDIND